MKKILPSVRLFLLLKARNVPVFGSSSLLQLPMASVMDYSALFMVDATYCRIESKIISPIDT